MVQKNLGFKTIGAPNKKGSLTLNNTGIELAFPIAFNSFDLARKANIKQITRVAPVPLNKQQNIVLLKLELYQHVVLLEQQPNW